MNAPSAWLVASFILLISSAQGNEEDSLEWRSTFPNANLPNNPETESEKYRRDLVNGIYPDIWSLFRSSESEARQESDFLHDTKGVAQNIISSALNVFQILVDREQAFLDLVTCRNCGSNPWQSFLNAMANIPTLGWVMRPPAPQGPKAEGTFIAATNVKGVVSGVGGSIYAGLPTVEYTFNNNHVKPATSQQYRDLPILKR